MIISTLTPKDQPQQHFPPKKDTLKRNPTTNNYQSVINPKSNNTVCRQWNGHLDCDGIGCDYDHACKTCLSAEHTAKQHREKGIAASIKNL